MIAIQCLQIPKWEGRDIGPEGKSNTARRDDIPWQGPWTKVIPECLDRLGKGGPRRGRKLDLNGNEFFPRLDHHVHL